MQSRNNAVAFAQVSAEAAQCDDVSDAALAYGMDDSLALAILLGAVIGPAGIGRQ